MTETPSIECADAVGPSPATLEDTLGYWHELIDEKAAADFLGLKDRFMQNRRQQGNGPRYVLISARCVRYRRADLRAWADARVRISTSDPGQEPS